MVLLIFKWTETVLFALNLSFWGHGHVGLLFTNEEQKMACDVFDPLPHISPLALFMTSLIQTAGHRWQPSLSCFITFKHQCFSKQDQEIKWNAAVHDLCVVPFQSTGRGTRLCLASPLRELDHPQSCQQRSPLRELDHLQSCQQISPLRELDHPQSCQQISPIRELDHPQKLSATFPSKRIRPSAKFP